MSDGIGCECFAQSAGECGCPDVDWTPREVVCLRQQLAEREKELSVLKASPTMHAVRDAIQTHTPDEPSLWRWQDDEHCHHFTLAPDKAPCYATAYYTRPQTDDANDAARYRWLRTWVGDFDGLAALNIAEPTTPEELDAAIDAAMSAERKE